MKNLNKNPIITDENEIKSLNSIFEKQILKNNTRIFNSNLSEKNRYTYWNFKKTFKYDYENFANSLFENTLKDLHNDLKLNEIYEGCFLKGSSRNKKRISRVDKIDLVKKVFWVSYKTEIGFIERKLKIFHSLFSKNKIVVLVEEKISFDEAMFGYKNYMLNNQLIKNRAVNWQIGLLLFENKFNPNITQNNLKKIKVLKKVLEN